MAGILAEIVARRKADLARRREEVPPALLEQRLASRPADHRPFAAALVGEGVALIAEIKRRAPSAGVLQAEADPARWARLYAAAGASALSVLTEPHYFGGEVADLEAARAACALPTLRKDFIVDSYQLLESAAVGADAVLLIARILPDPKLQQLLAEAAGLGLECLVEVHDPAELERAVAAGAAVIGVNNRDLADFSVDLNRTVELLGQVPSGTVVVAESGIERPEQVRALAEAGVAAVLVGTALMRSPAPAELLAELVHAGKAKAGNL